MHGIKTAKKLEDCFDGSMIYEVTLYQPIDASFITFLKDKGDLDYYADFPKPLFRLEVPGVCQLTGCLGSVTLRAVLYRNDVRKNFTRLENLLGNYRHDK